MTGWECSPRFEWQVEKKKRNKDCFGPLLSLYLIMVFLGVNRFNLHLLWLTRLVFVLFVHHAEVLVGDKGSDGALDFGELGDTEFAESVGHEGDYAVFFGKPWL